jgi:hypothetical protein
MRKKRIEEKRPSALGLHDHLPIEGPGRDDMMQLYAWDFDDALRAQEEWESRNIQGRGPLWRWTGAQELTELFAQYRIKKNAAFIIEALHVCSLNSLPIPRWCEMAFLAAYRKVRQYKAKSWDDVFGKPHPKNVKLCAKADEREKSLRVVQRVKQILTNNPARAIDRSLFGEAGKDFGIGDSLAEKYYYKWGKRFLK